MTLSSPHVLYGSPRRVMSSCGAVDAWPLAQLVAADRLHQRDRDRCSPRLEALGAGVPAHAQRRAAAAEVVGLEVGQAVGPAQADTHGL